MTYESKPCPLCGGAVIAKNTYEPIDYLLTTQPISPVKPRGTWVVECEGCGHVANGDALGTTCAAFYSSRPSKSHALSYLPPKDGKWYLVAAEPIFFKRESEAWREHRIVFKIRWNSDHGGWTQMFTDNKWREHEVPFRINHYVLPEDYK